MRRPPLATALLAGTAIALAGCAAPDLDPGPEPEATTSASPTSSACASGSDTAAPPLVVTPFILCAADGAPWQRSRFTAIVEMPGDPDRTDICDPEVDAFYAAVEPARSSAVTLATGEPGAGTFAIAAWESGGAEAVAALDAFVAACAPPAGTWEPLSADGWTGIEARLFSEARFAAGRTYWIVVEDRFALVQVAPGPERPVADLDEAIATVLREQRLLLEG